MSSTDSLSNDKICSEKDCCKEAANHIIDCNLKMKPEDN